MARTIAEIQDAIIAEIQADSNLSGLTSVSSTAIWRLITRVVASAIFAFEVINDAFRLALLDEVNAMKPHTLRWYQEKAKAFQYGSDLPEGSDEYDNTALDDATVAAQKLVAAAAATEEGGKVKIKVAGVNNLTRQFVTLDTPVYNAFTSYMNEIRDAGVVLETLNILGDKLTIAATIYYDPLVLTSTGARADAASATPVQDAIKAYLKALPFNGMLIRSALFDVLQAVDGVYSPVLASVQAGKNDATALGEVQVQYLPFAGWFNSSTLTINLTFVSKDSL